MSGHNKWSKIKHKKGAADAKKGKIYTKLIKELTIAAKLGGGDPDGNPRLRTAIAAARAENMPNDNVDRAIKKGTGELEGVSYEEFTLEGYGPNGVGIMLDILTDNRNRAVAEVRSTLTKNGGNMGADGSVSWNFEKKGMFIIEKGGLTEDKIMEAAIDAGLEDISDDGDSFTLTCPPEAFADVKDALDKLNVKYISAEVARVGKTTVDLKGGDVGKMVKLLEKIEDIDDVQKVHHNADMDEAELEKLAS
ncbi:MAG: YebC/PmpR family DNA-binding transcriptional regulator [Deltaproteobacteria bacterium]|nr:YebC/PmpR family DNA-binding transcriptional regulator [Deltaproteobacteria bacterium]